MINHLTEKKALALAGSSFLSTTSYLEKRDAFRSLGYSYNSTKSLAGVSEFTALNSKRKQEAEKKQVLLGNTTNKVSTTSKEAPPAPAPAINTFKKYDIQHYVKDILAGKGFRVSSCMKAISHQVEVVRTGEAYHFHGVMACGSIWLCPVCASKITETRRQELRDALNSGLYPVLVSVTLSHQRGDSLDNLLDMLNSSLRKLKAGRWWQAFKKRYGISAYVSSLEFTYSKDNGFHPHKHIIFFLESGAIDKQEFRQELVERYTALISRAGGYASIFHAVDMQFGAGYAGNYISKWGVVEELTKSNLKKAKEGSYSVWELAELGSKEAWAREAFKEYAYATQGKKAITFSHGARAVLGLEAEKSDAEIAQKEAKESEVLAVIPRDVWKVVLLLNLQASILIIASFGKKDLLLEYLKEIEAKRWLLHEAHNSS